MKGTLTATIEWEGHEVYFYVTLYGNACHYPERRVDGNPTMIESFEENGVNVKMWDFEEVQIDGVTVDMVLYEDSDGYKALIEEIDGYIDSHEDDIEWEYDE